mgnify:CR=1 FL=1
MKLALIGAGQRGMIYANYAYDSKNVDIVAVVEPDETRRKVAAKSFHVPKDRQFASSEDFFALGKIADAIIIASMDRDHYKQSMKALELSYDILLEKPISPDPGECLNIQERANEKGCMVTVCHVLRYTSFFIKLKEIIDSKELGKVISIQHNENIGNFHMAHSFVRGNWRRSDLSSSLIMQKSCHDMDILAWLANSNTKRIASFGGLQFFKEENAPANSTDRCLHCPAAKGCRFDARKAYLPIRGSWPAMVLTQDQTVEGIEKALEEGPYGRCVYRCDNDVCDHQVVLIEFDNDIKVSFHLSGFTNKISRTIKVMCEHGEIRGDAEQNLIEITHFASNQVDEYSQTVIHTQIDEGGHGGGDVRLMDDFLSNLEAKNKSSISSIDKSVESHLMAYAAEEARRTGCVVDVKELRKRFQSSKQ